MEVDVEGKKEIKIETANDYYKNEDNSIIIQNNSSIDYLTVEKNMIVVNKKVFGKKLAFISGFEYNEDKIFNYKLFQNQKNDDNNQQKIENKGILEARLSDYELIRKIKIGEIYKLIGIYKFDNIRQNERYFHINEIHKLSNNDVEEDKKEVIDNIDYIKNNILDNKNSLKEMYIKHERNNKALCNNIIKFNICNIKNCDFRHEITEIDKKKIALSEIKRTKMIFESHENDNFSEKKSKSNKDMLFAEFIVNTYGLDYLKSGPILDIAGGKGLLSFYLTTKYGLDTIIIDPRGAVLPKKKAKELNEKNIVITDYKCYFDENFNKEIILKSSLLVGLHPDEATELIVEIALKNDKKFAIVPCCVFPNLFNKRFLNNGNFVSDYPKFINYLKEKIPLCKEEYMNFEGKNKVLFN